MLLKLWSSFHAFDLNFFCFRYKVLWVISLWLLARISKSQYVGNMLPAYWYWQANDTKVARNIVFSDIAICRVQITDISRIAEVEGWRWEWERSAHRCGSGRRGACVFFFHVQEAIGVGAPHVLLLGVGGGAVLACVCVCVYIYKHFFFFKC